MCAFVWILVLTATASATTLEWTPVYQTKVIESCILPAGEHYNASEPGCTCPVPRPSLNHSVQLMLDLLKSFNETAYKQSIDWPWKDDGVDYDEAYADVVKRLEVALENSCEALRNHTLRVNDMAYDFEIAYEQDEIALLSQEIGQLERDEEALEAEYDRVEAGLSSFWNAIWNRSAEYRFRIVVINLGLRQIYKEIDELYNQRIHHRNKLQELERKKRQLHELWEFGQPPRGVAESDSLRL